MSEQLEMNLELLLLTLAENCKWKRRMVKEKKKRLIDIGYLFLK